MHKTLQYGSADGIRASRLTLGNEHRPELRGESVVVDKIRWHFFGGRTGLTEGNAG
jgi:hypothetical protein